MSAKKEMVTSEARPLEYFYVMTIRGWEPVVYKSLEAAYELMYRVMEMDKSSPDKTLEEVRKDLDTSRSSVVRQIRKGVFAGFYSSTIVTFHKYVRGDEGEL